MQTNRSIPAAVVIPVLAYPDVNQASEWLCHAFRFSVRLRIGTHRVQLNVGDGAVIIREFHPCETHAPLGFGHSTTVRIADADGHCRWAREHGAHIKTEPTTHPFGERQYIAVDLWGHVWTFSQSVMDIHPSEWGGTAEEL